MTSTPSRPAPGWSGRTDGDSPEHLRWHQVVRSASSGSALPDDGSPASASRPPLLPWFVVGFVAAVLLRSTGLLPAGVLEAVAVVQQLLLATAMAALGLGVHLRSIVQVGPRPLVLGAASTAVAVAVGGAGAWLLGPGLSLG